MENSLRSKRTREAAIAAAFAILARDGAAKLTIDAVARESGISKGGILHHFRSKEAVLHALLEYEIEQGDAHRNAILASLAVDHPEPQLAAHIAAFRQASSLPHSAAFAIAAALGDAPDLLAKIKTKDAERLATVKAQAADPMLAQGRRAATMGIVVAERLGLSPFSPEDRERLFDYLQADGNWNGATAVAPVSQPPPRVRKAAAKQG